MEAESARTIAERATTVALRSRQAAGAVRRSSVSLAPAARDDGPHVLYLVHDLNDPSVRRRVMMLQRGGARVTLAGFSRKSNPFARIDGLTPIDLGRTHDGRFAQRLASVARAAFTLSRRLGAVARPDVVVARNLEMLALARRAAAMLGGGVPIVYECLDIHRLLLRTDAVGRLFRAVERRLGSGAALLVTSSPAFREQYFDRFRQFDGPIELLENKVLEIDVAAQACAPGPTPPPGEGEPWKIGWFGALRCRRSLEILSAFSRRMEGRFEIVLRGRPALDQLGDFDQWIAAEPFVSYHGPYSNPEDLGRIYGEVHFSWLIDFFEEGLNSNWLLPNRLYEGCRYSTVPIAMKGTETGRFLARREIGISLDGDPEVSLGERLSDVDAGLYLRAADAVRAQAPRSWVIDRDDCLDLVERLAELAGSTRSAVR